MGARLIGRRKIISSIGAASSAALICTAPPRRAAAALPPISQADHEKYMRLAIAESAHTRKILSAAVIVKPAIGEVMARGINNTDYDPRLHGEFTCISNYIERNGNRE